MAGPDCAVMSNSINTHIHTNTHTHTHTQSDDKVLLEKQESDGVCIRVCYCNFLTSARHR